MAATAVGRPAALKGDPENAVDCVVVGAGPAGLAVAAMAKKAGLAPVLLERGDAPAQKWTERYDCLRINTSALTSFLPGRRFPLGYGRWPTRDQLVAYYRKYAARHELDIRTNAEVEQIERDGDGWLVRTQDDTFRSASVVVATGKDGTPYIPDWPGRAEFGGEISHSADYRNAEPYRDKRVLVVGAGSSALDICLEAFDAGASEVSLSIRTPPHIVRRAVGPLPADLVAIAASRLLPRERFDRMALTIRRHAIGDLTEFGLAFPSDGFTERVLEKGMIPTIDPGRFVPAIKKGHVKIVPPIERLEGDTARLEDGTCLAVDAIIAATGFGRGLDGLVGHLGVLDDKGHPLANGASELPQAPGLYFIGFSDVLTGNLRQIRLDARPVARAAADAARKSALAAA